MILENINISEKIRKAIGEMGFEELTSIQEECIPLIEEGHDIIGQSHTGTGKTAAFAIPILDKIDADLKKPQVLILCPTRELSVQVCNEFNKIGKYYSDIKSVAVYGGEPISKQIISLRKGAQIIIGTPGRTMDHIRRKTIKVENINVVILDEADEMLKMGFREDIEVILQDINEDRQTILFSATMPKTILDITKKYQKDPKLVKVKSKVITADTITQEYSNVKQKHKMEAIYRILDVDKPKRCIIFCNKKSIVDDVASQLQLKGYNTDKIHGDLKQEVRLQVLNKFNNSIINTLVATDVAARGLDIQEVDLIINYDVPEKEDYYVHRIGRSGRAGNKGHAITLVSSTEQRRLQDIMFYTKKDITKRKLPTLEQVNERKIELFINEVIETINNNTLDREKDIIRKIEDYDISDIAAALIKMNNDFMEKSDFEDINSTESSNRQKSSTTDMKSSRGRTDRKRKNNKNMSRLFLNVGKIDMIRPSHILGAITGEANISGDQVGSIDMFEKFSFVDVANEVAKTVVKKLDNKKIKDKKVSVEMAKSSS